VRLRLTLEYDGTDFRGWAAQPGLRTVEGELRWALGRIFPEWSQLAVAGRTDAGVHAWGNVVHFDTDVDVDLVALQRNLNGMLGPAIAVRSAEVAAPTFNARHDAVARRYRYTVLNRLAPDPFLARTTWHVPQPLDLSVLRLTCDPLIGEHDFSSFCRAQRRVPDASMVRLVYDARWVDAGDGLLRFDIDASSFCQQMVRALVGTMVPMGLGKQRAGEMAGILRARDRSRANRVAPARGLCLWEVVYPDSETDAPVPRSHWRDRDRGTG
jgi:tRNA pseudouridine38-40 synthase